MFILQESNGELNFHEVKFNDATRVNPEVLVPYFKAATKEPFTFRGVNMQQSVFVKTNHVVQTIFCPLLKWSSPLKYHQSSGRFSIDQNSAAVDFYIKDIIIVAKHEEGERKLYILDKHGRIPFITNIYNTSKICIENVPQGVITPPQSIISIIEATPGNADLPINGYLDINEEKGKPVLNYKTRPHQVGRDITQYIQDYVQPIPD